MNTTLWNRVEAFNLDEPLSEYGFSTRLAFENGWTIAFTAEAILEYKKFMYLAATADGMVSPSEIVDIVWHQHLIFTQSYDALCSILGKKIEHVPSTHNKAQADVFKQAKELTEKVYTEQFGQQPEHFWKYADMYEPLGLQESGVKIGAVVLIAVALVLVVLYPAWLLLGGMIRRIGNPDFLIEYVVAIIVALVALQLYSRTALKAMVEGWNKQLFVFKLLPVELICIKTGKVGEVVHACVNHLVGKDKIAVVNETALKVNEGATGENAMEHCIVESIRDEGTVSYKSLWTRLCSKPVFTAVSQRSGTLVERVTGSKAFVKIYTVNCVVLSILLLIGGIRIINGLTNHKPVEFLVITLVIYAVAVLFYLQYVSGMFSSSTLPAYYKQNIIPEEVTTSQNWEWGYVVFGAGILAASFEPLVRETMPRNDNSTWGDGSSSSDSGSSCGSSCSSGCGGCGGGGD